MRQSRLWLAASMSILLLLTGASGLCEKPGTILVAIKRASGEMVFAPADNEMINPGDSLVALAEAERLKEIERMMGS